MTAEASTGIFESWARKSLITFPGYTGGEALSNFPVLLQFQEGVNGFSYSQLAYPTNAADLRFSSADGLTELSYEIEKWNTSGVSLVWVRLPVLTNGFEGIWVYWERPDQSVPAYATNGATWDSQFVGVWHLAGTNFLDSTVYGANGIMGGTVTPVSGVVDGACDFDGGGTDKINGTTSSRYTPSNSFTVSAWIQADPSTAYRGIAGTYTTPNGWIFGLYTGSSNELVFWNGAYRMSMTAIPTNQWKHVAFTRNGATSNGTFYVDGKAVKVVPNIPVTASSGAFRIGSGGTSWDGSYCFDGRIDEVRLSRLDRSSNWLWACWLNQASNSAFVSQGAIQYIGRLPQIDNAGGATGLSTTGAVLNGQLVEAGMSNAFARVYYGTANGGTNAGGWALWQDVGWVTNGPLAAPVSGLTPDETYYYTYFTSNGERSAWAAPSSIFITGELTIEKTADAYEEGLRPGSFRVSRPAATVPESLTVAYAQVGGTAAAGSHFVPLSGTITIPAGEPSAEIAVEPVEAFLDPDDKTLTLALAAAKAPIGSPSSASMTLYTEPLPNIWIRAETGASAAAASVATNWSKGVAPTNGDVLYLGSNSALALTWDLTNVVVSRWVQADSYTGTVTIPTRYPGQGAFTNMTISGDCLVGNGVWTHPANTGTNTAADRLKVTVGGDFTLGTAAVIQVTGRGFAATKGPGGGVSSQRLQTGVGASHGGRGAYGLMGLPAPTYDSVVAPTNLGSGCHGSGGGCVDLHVAGRALVDGTILADGGLPPINYGLNPGSAGGTVSIRAGVLGGGGIIRATGAGGYFGGGGGRIALVATNADTFGGLTNVNACGGIFSTLPRGAAGTIYWETRAQGPGRGLLTVDNSNQVTTAFTPLPWDLQPPASPAAPGTASELLTLTLALTNGARVLMNDHLRMRDLAAVPTNTLLALNARSLYLSTNEHAVGNGTVSSNFGRLVWTNGAVSHDLVVSARVHGAVSAQTGWWPEGSSVEFSATPDPGFAFIRWDGDIPAADQSNNPASVVMDRTRNIHGLFGNTEASTLTWLGGSSGAASDPLNWYPPALPSAGARIVLDATSGRQTQSTDYVYSWNQQPVNWDLNLPVSNWFQDGYTSMVLVLTRYPGEGSFTNFSVLGSCVISNGLWAHAPNSGTNSQVDRLCVTVGGTMIIGPAGGIDLAGRGFAATRGPGAGTSSFRASTNGIAASHGGRGGHGAMVQAADCSGTFATPTNLGSGSQSEGGGALWLSVGGQMILQGTIDASGAAGASGYSAGSGGSLYITAGSLAGDGLLLANGGAGYFSGGGGRVAVILRESTNFAKVNMTALGGYNSGTPNNCGAAGTVYRRSPVTAQLTIDNNGVTVAQTDVFTELPAVRGGTAAEAAGAILTLTNRGAVGLTSDLNMRDLFIKTNSTTRLHLQGRTLKLAAFYHPSWGHTNWVTYNGGQILWGSQGVLILIR